MIFLSSLSFELSLIHILFDAILKYIPAPEGDPDADTQVLISTIDYNEYVGRIGVGKVENGTIAVNQELTLLNHHDLDKRKKVKISKLYEFDGLHKVEVKEATIGSIVDVYKRQWLVWGITITNRIQWQYLPYFYMILL